MYTGFHKGIILGMNTGFHQNIVYRDSIGDNGDELLTTDIIGIGIWE